MTQHDKWFIWFAVVIIGLMIQWAAHYIKDGVDGVNIWLDIVPSVIFGILAIININQSE
jgi:hypothetical protein